MGVRKTPTKRSQSGDAPKRSYIIEEKERPPDFSPCCEIRLPFSPENAALWASVVKEGLVAFSGFSPAFNIIIS